MFHNEFEGALHDSTGLWLLGLLGLGLLFGLLYGSIVVVRGDELALLERRWLGRRMEGGRVVALTHEVGVQARVLAPGVNWVIPFLYAAKKHPLVRVDDDEVGLVEAVDGRPVPPGRIFARVVQGHELFQDGEAFLRLGGERGPQLDLLPPGLYRLNPYFFRVFTMKAVDIPIGKVGRVSASDGAPIAKGRLLARSVPGHDNFQNAGAFLAAGGEKGPQIDVLLPGRYRINTQLFDVEVRPATVVATGQVGIVTAKDGEALPSSEFVAREVAGHRDFQDAATFLAAGGQRGPQLGFLRPGTYYVNPAMFDVTIDRVAEVERGFVAVIVSNVGLDPTAAEGALGDPLVSGVERYVVDAGFRGIQREVAGPGTYYLNRLAYIPHLIPTTNITIDWAGDPEDRREHAQAFDPLAIVSKDGFEMTISVKVIIRVLPEQAPHMVARIGTIENLIEHVIRPLIDSSFRNQASSTEAMQFMQDRHEEQKKAEHHISRELERYHVRCVSVLICQIILPERLMETLTNKVVAAQQMSMFDAQRAAEDRRREMENTRAQADLQPALVKAEVNVQIAAQKRQETVLLAEGQGQATRLEQEGVAAGIVAVGRAEGERVSAVGRATADAYERQARAVGKSPLALIEVVRRVSEGGVKITPEVLVSSSDGQVSSANGLVGLLSAFVAKLLAGDAVVEPRSDSEAKASETEFGASRS
jgi:regulator of protease activity HflC (stomatin/prohibitin superfamily)